MHSIQTKQTFLTTIAIVVAMIVTTIISVISVANMGNDNSTQILRLLCETGQQNIDYYLTSVQKSVDFISQQAAGDLNENGKSHLHANIEEVRNTFEDLATKTNGAMTYYYRINPDFSKEEKGFWYIDFDNDDRSFVANEVTDLTDFEPNDPGMVWYTYPKKTGRSIWITTPYITKNLPNYYVISYNAPIFIGAKIEPNFVGVIGVEINFTTISEQIDNISLNGLKNGYAFINDEDGTILYHPKVDVLPLSIDEKPKVPDGLLSNKELIRYKYDGENKIAYWLRLENGTHINVSVPIYVINGPWQKLIVEIVIAAAIILAAFVTVTILFSRHLTKPLRDLTDAAEQINAGNFNVKLDYDKDDEIGVLSMTVNRLIEHLGGYIADLNNLAYADALTSVRNKSAFDAVVSQMQIHIENDLDKPIFAIGIFDVDDLKMINDEYGHDKGDVYLKNSAHLICRVFEHSAIFRIGGDEFAVILQNEDYGNKEKLRRYFLDKSKEICAFAKEPWEKICVSIGIATYDPKMDKDIGEVIRRADRLMYENKHERKKNNGN